MDELKAIAINNYKDEIKLRLKSAKLELKKRDRYLQDEGMDDYTDEKYKQENYKMGWSKDSPNTLDIAIQQGRNRRGELEITNEKSRQEIGQLLAKLRTHSEILYSQLSYCSRSLMNEREAAVMELAHKLLGPDWDCAVPT